MLELPVRQPAVAGQFYPDNPDALRRSVKKYVDEATLPDGLNSIRAIIAPHAGYVYSGPTAGYAFKALTTLPQKEWTVFLLGPAHRAYFGGVALGNYSAFRTPLGDAPIAVDRVAEMLTRSSLYTRATEAHVHEHCLEVEVPFLQVALPDFRLVPMLFGDVDPLEITVELANHIGEDDLIVVSNDLSHFHPYDQAQRLDHAVLEAVLNDDERGVLGGEACGRAPVVTLMGVARRKGWQPHLLDYRTSGDTAGDRMRVVGYGSVAYTG
ncbi:MAG: AmmeMemoRadiSam system protein B [Chloroflexi bacterium]|nr:AmmeMemoRadiSam system protein B [Chloroflexota bacterium]